MQTVEAALFDFDGVIVDTEPQYSVFWNLMGREYLGIDGIEQRIKGQTLTHIFGKFFGNVPHKHAEINERLEAYEAQMTYDYIAGVEDFADDLRRHGVRMCIVTSSNDAKMASALRFHPDLEQRFGPLLTAEHFQRSKPDPQCFEMGMRLLGSYPRNTVIFEDSFNGLRAAMSTHATVVGLSTTNSRADIEPLCHFVVDDFRGLTYEKLTHIGHQP